MSRRLFLPALLAVLVLPRAARAEDEPILRGRKLSEWITLLKEDKSVKVRRAALYAVELIGPKKSRKVLPSMVAALTGDAEPRIREAAAQGLGRVISKLKSDTEKDETIRLDSVREGLLGALRKDKEGRVREAAAAALGRMGDDARGAVSALAAALKDKHAGTRTAAADALRQIGKGAADAVPALQEAVRDKDAPRLMRAQAALALGRIGAPEAVPAVPDLGKVVADSTAPTEVRKAAAEALGLFGRDADEAAPALAKALTATDADTDLRRAAAAALDQIGRPARAALPGLKKALEDRDKFVRTLSLHAIGRIKDLGDQRKGVVTAILACLNDPVIEVRVAAIETFGALGADGLGPDTKAIIDRLTDASRDSQKDVRDAALNALKKIK